MGVAVVGRGRPESDRDLVIGVGRRVGRALEMEMSLG